MLKLLIISLASSIVIPSALVGIEKLATMPVKHTQVASQLVSSPMYCDLAKSGYSYNVNTYCK